jgi:hypothetical protein
MGTFSYNTLRAASQGGNILGKWSGYSVFSASKYDLDEKGSGACYILYDDDNKIVRKDSYGVWKVYGEVDETGNVEEYQYIKKYKREPEKTYEPEKTEEAPAADLYVEEEVIGDVKTDIDVDKVLKSVATTTIEDLLKGFNYGL